MKMDEYPRPWRASQTMDGPITYTLVFDANGKWLMTVRNDVLADFIVSPAFTRETLEDMKAQLKANMPDCLKEEKR